MPREPVSLLEAVNNSDTLARVLKEWIGDSIPGIFLIETAGINSVVMFHRMEPKYPLSLIAHAEIEYTTVPTQYRFTVFGVGNKPEEFFSDDINMLLAGLFPYIEHSVAYFSRGKSRFRVVSS